MKRRLRIYATNDYGQRVYNPDVRPLNEREKKMDTRKGMKMVNVSKQADVKKPLFEF